ncbi:uncharacterized protein LOC108103538 [Drosophila eugracilis]|uniref:uncharacterized protein LOC108103538 n=1 Tax=Drosophila eugracilis TaxID=29029 RepID=UPI0007E75987|nr:uncharacterized protein LOC108103538 [Drosophila eugracilis]
MLHSSYNRAPRRQLIPNLFSNILQVIADADHPLTEHEIMEAVADRLDRNDEELKRQIIVSLNDALIYGYLRVKNYRYSIVPSRLDPNDYPNQPDQHEASSSIATTTAQHHHHHHHRMQERISSGTNTAIEDHSRHRNQEGSTINAQTDKRVTTTEPERQTN